jgi:hypothetical protein
MKKCRVCNIEKHIDEFHRKQGHRDGYSTQCKQCVSIYMKNFKNGIKVGKPDRFKIARDVRDRRCIDEAEFSLHILKTLGYELEGEISVHQQFLLRHNLAQ